MGEGLAGTPGSVSVVIVAYRSGPELARCLRADYPDWDITISLDEILDQLAELAAPATT